VKRYVSERHDGHSGEPSRREPVEHEHFRAPTWAPVVGAVVCLALASPLTGRESGIYLRAAILLAIGIVIWFVNRLVVGRVDDFDPAAITK
jgi:basic amino acid/polyamine antiporter, APA family